MDDEQEMGILDQADGSASISTRNRNDGKYG